MKTGDVSSRTLRTTRVQEGEPFVKRESRSPKAKEPNAPLPNAKVEELAERTKAFRGRAAGTTSALQGHGVLATASVAKSIRDYEGVVRHKKLAADQFDGSYEKKPDSRFAGNGEAMSHQEYAAKMQGIREEGLRGLQNPPNASRVLYPLSGDDATLPMHLFPEATEIILIDSHPFAHPGVFDSEAIALRNAEPNGWVNFRDLDGEQYMARAIIPAIKEQFPEARILGVEVLETSKFDANNQLHEPQGWNRVLNSDCDPIRVPACHGILTFDMGPGSPKKTLIHLNIGIPRTEPETGLWWLNALRQSPPDAFVFKGSQDALGDAKESMLRDEILGWLKSNGGVVVEGGSLEKDSFEFLPAGSASPNAPYQKDFEAPYGYGFGRVRMTVLSGDNI